MFQQGVDIQMALSSMSVFWIIARIDFSIFSKTFDFGKMLDFIMKNDANITALLLIHFLLILL
jgi:hypothetical protein